VVAVPDRPQDLSGLFNLRHGPLCQRPFHQMPASIIPAVSLVPRRNRPPQASDGPRVDLCRVRATDPGASVAYTSRAHLARPGKHGDSSCHEAQ
jgi:hypothetical protein